MSHTLNKLKQSEVDRGLRKATEKRSSQGLLITFFVIILVLFLVIINFRDVIFSEQQHDTSKNITASSSITLVKTSPEKKINIAKISDKPALQKKKKKVENVEKKDQNTETLKVAEFKLLAQQKTSFPFDPEILGNLKFDKNKKKRKRTKKDLKKQIRLKNISTHKDQSVSEQEKSISTHVNSLSSILEKSDEQPEPDLWKNLSAQFKESMPKMKLNGISFFDKEEDHYVIINMNKYQVDDIIEKGPTIDEIRKDSVIMFYEGKQFTLPLRL